MFSLFTKKIMLLPLILGSGSAFAENIAQGGVLSANLGLVSQYIFRGSVENNDIAMHAGVEYLTQNGFTVGYWGSTLDYDATDAHHVHGFEHDLYINYAQSLNPNWAYKVQATAYIYQNGGTIDGENSDRRRTTAVDVLAELAYKELRLDLSVLLADASFGNTGDAYISAAYRYALPQDFYLNTAIGASIYQQGHDDSLLQTRKNFVFSEARLGISKTIPNTGLTASLDYVMGGQDRLGEHYNDHTVLGLNYSF